MVNIIMFSERAWKAFRVSKWKLDGFSWKLLQELPQWDVMGVVAELKGRSSLQTVYGFRKGWDGAVIEKLLPEWGGGDALLGEGRLVAGGGDGQADTAVPRYKPCWIYMWLDRRPSGNCVWCEKQRGLGSFMFCLGNRLLQVSVGSKMYNTMHVD